MSIEKAKAYLEEKGLLEHVIELEAYRNGGGCCQALGRCTGHDRQTMSFFTGRAAGIDPDRGTARWTIGNTRTPFIPRWKNDPLRSGGAVDWPCARGRMPLASRTGWRSIWMRAFGSLKRFIRRRGNDHSAVRLTIPEPGTDGGRPGLGGCLPGPDGTGGRMRRNRRKSRRRQRPLPGIMRIAPLRGEKCIKAQTLDK